MATEDRRRPAGSASSHSGGRDGPPTRPHPAASTRSSARLTDLQFPRRRLRSPDLAGRGTGRLSRPESVMSSFEDADTEETVTCLQMTVYHPGQLQSGIFKSIRFCNKEKFPSIEEVKFGRNSNICRYTFQDKQVSRVQFALQPFKQFNSSVLSFEIKNMSKKTSLMVDNQELGYLNKMDLPYKCLLRFGEYQFLLEKEDGESVESFETQFILSPRPLLQENNWPAQSPIPEDGGYSSYFTHRTSPTEMDENEL